MMEFLEMLVPLLYRLSALKAMMIILRAAMTRLAYCMAILQKGLLRWEFFPDAFKDALQLIGTSCQYTL